MADDTRPVVLVVEDDPGIAELEKDRLQEAGYGSLVAGTADEAIAHLRATHVDLILLDYRLPGAENGLDFYARVKAAGYDLPVILVTGYGNEATVIQALRTGVRDFVTKSVEYLDYLPEAVERVLRQVRTEHQLAESEARLVGVIESATDAVIVTEDDGRISLFNPAAERMFRCPAEQALGREFTEFIPENPSSAITYDLSTDTDFPVLPRFYQGRTGTRPDGSTFPAEASVSIGRANGRRFTAAVIRDVTERQRLEEQFRQAQKMEVIGQLAGGVAHDFNNLLTIINGYSDLLIDQLPEGPSRDLLDEIRRAGERSAGLTRQLLSFSRKEIVTPKVVNPNAVIRDVEKMLRRIIGEDVRFVTALNAKESVRVDPGQLEQVLMNLSVNARDAMPSGGTLTIETFDVVRHGGKVGIAVGDSGTGMTEEIRSRIFEPFFTTKGVGKGTGLGLAVVHGVVTQSEGTIEVESVLGAGTTFRLFFPAVSGENTPVAKPKGLRALPRGTETILLVEDEDAVRVLAKFILQSNGYTVLDAADGAEAIRMAAYHDGAIDLLLTDVIMPEIGGREVADRIIIGRPRLRIMYLSGYNDDSVVRSGIAAERVHFLQKPFTAAILAEKVRAVLDGEEHNPISDRCLDSLANWALARAF
ncbi:MAG TPA: response regulator [Fimbriiglobus sp.]|jgi:PAS domain S-box-containing protein